MDNIDNLQTVWGDVPEEPNVELCFSCHIEQYEDVTIEFIAKDIYNLFVNGQFVAYGPGRAAKGYSRIERLDISPFLTKEEDLILVYVQSNETNTLCLPKEKPLFGVRIWEKDRIVKETEDFQCYLMTDKMQKVERMSSQRGFLEVYDMKENRDLVEEGHFPRLNKKAVACPQLLERRVSYSKNSEIKADLIKSGEAYMDRTKTWENDLTKLLDSGEELDCYARRACDCVLSRELDSFCFDGEEAQQGFRYLIYAFPRVSCGKFKIRITVSVGATLWLTYDDLLIDGYVKFNREQIVHGIKWNLEKGEYTLYSQEVYSAKYIQLMIDGEAEIEEVSVICIENPDVSSFTIPDMEQELQTIVKAAQNTFVQNAYDIFTDCPSRERAGWLCDSYFLGKAEQFFTKENKVERNFLENYLLYENEIFPHPGIIPMCYPSQVKEDDYIPNWILWYILELEDYQERTQDTAFVALHKQRIRDILDFFQGCENEYGLLENLEGWIFVEWSKASDFTEGVNFPSNMLYADALRAAGILLGDNELLRKSTELKRTIREVAYDGEVYRDNAIRVNGKLERTDQISEACQIFAAFFRIEPGDVKFYERFKNRFREVDSRKKIWPTALFIGGILRLMVLFQMEEYGLLLSECKERFLGMAKKTGTIWEFIDESASCNHGFGSILGKLICESVEKLKGRRLK